MKTGPKPRPVLERMEKFIVRDPNSGCWLWSGALSVGGYAMIGNPQRRGGYVYGHRAAFEHAYGPIPDGLEIDHKCRIRMCVNPAHMEAVSHSENMKRGWHFRRIQSGKI